MESLVFFIDLILPTVSWLEGESASNRNEYQGKGGRCLRLKNLPLSSANCLESVKASASRSPKDLSRPV